MRPRKLNWLFGYQAVVYAAGLLLITGLVPDWGAWYSTSLPYRTQTEALLKGDLAVSRNVADLKFDHTWSEQGVHQVWGLGVPLWRLPFEAAAKLCGFDGFPDRIAFGLFASLVCFVALKVWANFGDEWSSSWRTVTGFGAGFLIPLLFPPFLTLLQVRGAVWEEAVSYEYLYGIAQVTLLVVFVKQPTIARLLLVCALAGLGGLIRPTLVFYGFATMVIATGVWVFNARQTFRELSPASGRSQDDEALTSPPPGDRMQTCPTLGRALPSAMLGLFLFALGGGVLYLTNLKRFGDGFEFGHKLNMQTLYGSMHATRFDDPFQAEPLPGAAKELFGTLFLASKFNGTNWYQERIFPGQSPTVRWREFYFRTYDWSYLPLLLLGWGTAIAAGFGLANSALPHSQAARAWTEFKLTVLTLGLWSWLATLPLTGFYLYAPVISSRYMLDFAPAFAAALAAAWLHLTACCQKRWSRALACLLLSVWLGTQLYLNRSTYAGPVSVSATELKALRDQSITINGSTQNTHNADEAGQRQENPGPDIPFDRVGWNDETGAVMPLVILFVKDPEFLELDFFTRPHPQIPSDPTAIRAKVGLEFLERERITRTADGWRVRFRGPQQPRWRDGLQGAFVATVPNEFLAERATPWILKSVRWHSTIIDDAPEAGTDHR